MLKELIDKAKSEGGVTYNFLNNYYPSEGYSVSQYKERESRVFALNEHEVIHFISKNYDLLTDKDNCIGIWWHKEMYYLDVVTVIKSYTRAMKIAKENQQLAIYDLRLKMEIELPKEVPLFEFDELLEDTQDQCIQDYLDSDDVMEYAIDMLRHMKFGVNGDILRGYDE